MPASRVLGHDQAHRADGTVDVLLPGLSALGTQGDRVIIRRHFLDGIQKGTVSLAFRRWRRPSVKPGGTLLTAAGLLHIGDIEIVTLADISNTDARRAGIRVDGP